MLVVQSALVADHQSQLRSEAAAARIVRSAALSGEPHQGASPRSPKRPEPRRILADLAVRLSLAAADTARRLDPAVEECFGGPSSPALGR